MKLSYRKGVSFSQLSTVALLFVLVGIILAIGAYVLAQVNTTAGFASTTIQAAAIGNATAGIGQLAQWMPIIAIVIAAGVVIAVLVGAFAFRRGGV
jgi:hypothetical protein